MREYTSFGWVNRGNGTAFLNGEMISLLVPATGVFSTNALEWVWEDAGEGIDLAWENHIRTCRRLHHDHCGPDASGTALIGFRPRRKREEAVFTVGKGRRTCGYVPDEKAEYSAIVRESVVQVVRSRWVVKGAPCSPCYPGQIDGETEGEFVAYAPPPEVFGEFGDTETKARVFPRPA